MVWWIGLACLHPAAPTPVAEGAPPQRETAVWHKAREQYVLAILHFDRGECDAGAKAMRTALMFDAQNDWLAGEAQERTAACEAGQ
jgi:hypothetical protein